MQISPIKIIILFIAGLSAPQLHAQVLLNGTVTDSIGAPVQSVSVILKKHGGILLAFAITDSAGRYRIQYNGVFIKDSLTIEANALGFKKQALPVTRATQTDHFKLVGSDVYLPNVTVKKQLLTKEGDTLSYDVATISTRQDRTIGDVIKKLPGVEVAENGQISYAGKPINRFYIDGDNLLDGRYNIAAKGIPNDLVSKVQILENHQPVKALKDLEKSDQAAMNLVLKDKARLKIMGSGDASAGTPGVYGIAANAMLFKKQVKFINYIKANNMGIDSRDELINHFDSDNASAPALLGAGIAEPGILKKRYLFNNVGVITGNHLLDLKNDHQLRINAFYLWDKQFQETRFSSTSFLPNDTIRYNEKQEARSVIHTFNTQFTLNANKKEYFFNNVTTIENTPTELSSRLQATSNNNISQKLSGTVTGFSNRFSAVKRYASGRVLEVFSVISKINNPATLEVTPGLYASQFNNNVPFAGLVQYAAVPTFYTDNFASFGKAGTKFQQRYRVGMSYQGQEVSSVLESQQSDGSKAPVADSFTNALHWTRMKIYVQPDYTYTSGSAQLNLSLPLTFQETKYTGRLVNNHATNLLLLPRLLLKYTTGKEAFFTLGYSYGDVYGDVTQAYDGYVMKGYRNFFTNGSLLNETKTHAFSGSYVFKDPLKIFFFSLAAGYTTGESNTINDDRLSQVLQQSRLIPFVNVSKSMQAKVTVSKYIFPLLSTVSGSIGWVRFAGNQLQNGNLVRSRNDAFSCNARISSKLTQWFNLGYNGTFSLYRTRLMDDAHAAPITASPRVEKWQHEAVVNFTVSPVFYIRVSGDNYHYRLPGQQTNDYTFVDAAVTYKLDKLKTDLEFSVTNLANIGDYGFAALSANSITESSSRIRPRMATVKFYFRF